MPRKKPNPDELERGASQMADTVTTLLRNLRMAQGELVEAALLVGLTWDQIAQVTGHRTGDAARVAHRKWQAGQP
jgi:hypothetical protein